MECIIRIEAEGAGKERGNCLSFSTPSYKPWIGFLKIGLKSISLVKLIHFLNHIKRFLSVKEMRIRSLVGRGLGHSGLILEGQLINV